MECDISAKMTDPTRVTCQNVETDRAERNPGALAEGCSDARRNSIKSMCNILYTLILMNETTEMVEPYELPDDEPVLEPVPATPALDLSGYNYDLVLTYKMIEDTDDQDTLFRIQFLQAFGISDAEYHPEIVSAVIDDLYERFRENPGIREILESHPLAGSGAGGDNSEMIFCMMFCMMFSFQIFDLFHTCMRHAKHNEEVPQTLRDEIADSLRQMF